MGHGNPESSYSQANLSYRKIKEYMQTLDSKIFVGTVDCDDMLIDNVIEELANTLPAQTTINLHPLMSIAGDHANNDMAGELDPAEPADAQSWKVRLSEAGYNVEDNNCILKGLGDYPEIVNVWVRHLNEAIENGK
jgi:sirohydrochlorin cobaltochelatase